MGDAKPVLLIAAIATLVVVAIGGSTIGVLYNDAFNSTVHRLLQLAHNQLHVFSAVAPQDRGTGIAGADEAAPEVLAEIVGAFERIADNDMGAVFSLVKRVDDTIVVLAQEGRGDKRIPVSIPASAPFAEPMRRALTGRTGDLVMDDFRGVPVLAVHVPVGGFGLGIVAEIEMAEIRAPYVRLGIIGGSLAVVIVGVVILLFFRVTDPMVKRLQESEERFRSAFEAAAHGMGLVALDGGWFKVNKGLSALVGYSEDELLTSDILAVIHPDDVEATWGRIQDYVAGKSGSIQTEVRLRAKGGKDVWAFLAASVVRDAKGRPLHLIVQVHDVSERKAEEVKVWRKASFDPVTGLPNRSLFADRLNHALSGARRDGKRLALVFLDLDHFKRVNDSLGHQAGDELLRRVGVRLSKAVRASDTVARLGGDEFTVVVPEVTKARDAETVVRKLLDVLAKPFSLEGQQLGVTGSIGIAFFPDDGTDPDVLLQNADSAMYRAKRRGRNRHEYFSPEMYPGALDDVRMENDLRRALENGEFYLLYQPIQNVRSGRVVGAEALLRWRHPERGTVMPNEFLPYAEKARLIAPICEWVLAEACSQARDWASMDFPDLSIVVKVTSRDCVPEDQVDSIKRILDETGVPPESLILEVTESVMFGEDRNVAETIQDAKALGIRFALNGFGTGFSSLGFLQRLPVDLLKIDGSFVGMLPNDPRAAALVGAILAVARSLEIGVIGEGVETETQLDFLRRHGCSLALGFHIGRPVTAEQFLEKALKRGLVYPRP